jgi:SM-20-related protein
LKISQSSELSEKLLKYAIENEAKYKPSMVYRNGEIQMSKWRISSTLNDLGEFSDPFKEKILATLPEILNGLGMQKFPIRDIELSITAHGDGAFFGQHIDTRVHEKTEYPRMISAVFYMHTTPKKFDGGNLKLFPIPVGESTDEPKEIAPDHNSIIIFPSIAPHEVLPVHAPNVEFRDCRFGLNCWIRRTL